jgi:hypothetical protein
MTVCELAIAQLGRGAQEVLQVCSICTLKVHFVYALRGAILTFKSSLKDSIRIAICCKGGFDCLGMVE